MIKRSKEEWQSLFQQQAESDLSINAFCKERGLCASYFSKRRKKLQQSAADTTPSSIFIPTKVSSPSSVGKGAMVLSYQGYDLTLPTSINEVWLANLLKALA